MEADGRTVLTFDQVIDQGDITPSNLETLTFLWQTNGTPQRAAELATIRAIRFPHIVSDEHWLYVLHECERWGFDPADVHAYLNNDAMHGQLEVVVLIPLALASRGKP